MYNLSNTFDPFLFIGYRWIFLIQFQLVQNELTNSMNFFWGTGVSIRDLENMFFLKKGKIELKSALERSMKKKKRVEWMFSRRSERAKV
jgi:hypothetical protein